MTTNRKYISEFIGLDLLRFILAVAVVIRHYYHFYGPFPDSPFNGFGANISEEPLYPILKYVYNYGHEAVQVFWLISGLIFYSVYNSEISNNEIGFGKFSFLRFSRLYPLHFITLLVVALLQIVYFQLYGSYFVYQYNSFGRFFLQLFFMEAWLTTPEHSFNIPVWSVSVEIFVYFVFFLVTAAGLTKGRRLTTLIFFTIVISLFGILPPFNKCLLFFFFGCLLARLMEQEISLWKLLASYTLLSVLFLVASALSKNYLTEDIGFLNASTLITFKLIPISSALVLIFIIAFRSVKSQWIISAFKGLGNMTYSLYLVHMPMQIVIFLVLRPDDYHLFNNPLMLLLFLASSMTVAWIVFEYFEKPAQRFLRLKYEQFKEKQRVDSRV